jgi:hypothetical protein
VARHIGLMPFPILILSFGLFWSSEARGAMLGLNTESASSGIPIGVLVSSENAQPEVRQTAGILFTGYGQNPKFSEFFQYIHEELKNYLGARVVLVEPGSVNFQGDSGDLTQLLDQLPGLGVRGMVFFRVDANEVGWIWLKVQCFDSLGKLLWEEKTDSLWSGAMTPSGCARAAVNRMQKKLKRRIGKAGLPERGAVEEPPKKPKKR